ncbi:MAG: low molecular weight phosphotyrosine protein phosphatase [Victivallaceae bacterium]|nr:low molecular weight phosphotyrosine protein phosphatase [Victivallaceae bacterium]
MTRILFVCHGNICRSPMAELVFNRMVAERGLSSRFHAESAAVSSEELGNPIYPPARRMLEANGFDCSGKYARKMTLDDYGKFELLVCMDRGNLARMKSICGGDPEGRMSMLLNRDVADPWYSGDFSTTWDDICVGCAMLLEKLTSKKEC